MIRKAVTTVIFLSFLCFVPLTTYSERVEETDQIIEVDDDLFCKVRDDEGNVIAKCWFCDCAELTWMVKSLEAGLW